MCCPLILCLPQEPLRHTTTFFSFGVIGWLSLIFASWSVIIFCCTSSFTVFASLAPFMASLTFFDCKHEGAHGICSPPSHLGTIAMTQARPFSSTFLSHCYLEAPQNILIHTCFGQSTTQLDAIGACLRIDPSMGEGAEGRGGLRPKKVRLCGPRSA